MDWDDVEYLLEKTYLSTRSFSLALFNKENALNLSTNGQLSKTSTECLHSQRKMLQLALDAYDTCKTDKDRHMLAGLISQYQEEFVLILGKDLKYPSVIAEKYPNRSSDTESKAELESFMNQLSINFDEKVDKESVDRTFETADSILASIHKSYQKSIGGGDEDDVVCLTQYVSETKLMSKSSEDLLSHEHQQQQALQSNPFMTARQALNSNTANTRSNTNNTNNNSYSGNGYNPAVQTRKILGAKRRCPPDSKSETNASSNYRDDGRDINTEFSYYNMNKAPPLSTNNNSNNNNSKPQMQNNNNNNANTNKQQQQQQQPSDEPVDERLAGIEPRIIEMIRNEIMHKVDNITWDSIAGLEHAKNSIKEIVVWPMLRPDLFIGLRGPPKGLLLFGPPGTGKTMIGKCIANQANATFFSISASSLTSKWVGEGEKMVRALFAVARCSQPAVIFIDEIDSLLTQRTDGEFEASRRIKTEFLVQFDGAGTSSEDRILVIGATNRPQEIDEAARRRLVKRLYIPLPDSPARSTIIKELLKNQANSLTEQDTEWICERTAGYSGSDMHGLCKEAAMVPFRSITDILNISASQLRPISREDFEEALTQVRASVSSQDLEGYLDWNRQFGSLSTPKN